MNSKKNYINSKDIDDSIIKQEFDGYPLNIVVLDGYIYRGDRHFGHSILHRPKFYGDYDSAYSYVKNNLYFKTYITIHPIKLLCLNDTKDNIKLIKDFIKYLINQDKYINNNIIKVTYILLQICFGLIEGAFNNLDLCGLDLNIIGNYLIHYKNQIKKKEFDDELMDLLKMIINKYQTNNIIPSRLSILEFDGILVSMLSEILVPYGIDGIWYNNSIKYMKLQNNEFDQKNQILCMAINRDLYKTESSKISCVPSDLCIFYPFGKLKMTKIEQKINDKLVNIDINLNIKRIQYKNLYNKYKKKYINSK